MKDAITDPPPGKMPRNNPKIDPLVIGKMLALQSFLLGRISLNLVLT
jgi:hypothetical protein